MHKRTIQEIADFFDMPMEWDGRRVAFKVGPYTTTTSFSEFIEKPDVNYVVKFEPRREELCTN